jgi:predicted nucleic acid-binding protein
MRFHTADFINKWGFEDGDILQSLILAAGVDIEKVSGHEILRKVLERHVLPQIKNDLEIHWIATLHNPARAFKVDGVSVDDHTISHPELKIEPQYVDVSDAIIAAVALEVAANTGQPQSPPGADHLR